MTKRRFAHLWMTGLTTLAFSTPCLAAAPTTLCAGDCNHDRTTAIGELVSGVSIALGRTGLAECPVLDLSGNGQADIGELVGAVGSAVNGCPPPPYETTKCEVPLPDGQDAANVECGFLTVPENRDRPNGRSIQLAVVRLRSTAANAELDPFVFLSGGPGQWAIANYLAAFTGDFLAPIQSKRDVVIFDQRGTGRSIPALNCPEVLTMAQGVAELLTPEQEAERDSANLLACHDRLIREGNDLTAYSSAATVFDINDLMAALGYERWNLYGLSYGTRVALTVLRDLPNDRIRSVILDSTVPVEVNLIDGRSTDRSLNLLFADCADDAACNAVFPDLRQTTFDLYESLNDEPITLQPTGPHGPFTVVTTGDRVIRLAGIALQSAALIPFLPLFTQSTAEGNTLLLTIAVAQIAQPELYSPGLQATVLCNEEEPFDTPDVVAMANQGVDPLIVHAYSGDVHRRVCPQWGTPEPDPKENQPVHSDVPALILAGEYDTATPTANGLLAAESLPNSFYFEFRGFGHVELFQQVAPAGPPSCAMRLIAEFLDDPSSEPDGTCVAAIPPPQFVLP